MFDNIGGKMKGIASTAFLLGAVGACALGVAVKTVFRGKEGVLVGLIIAGLGVALAYFNSIRLYAYGQLVENSDIATARDQGTDQQRNRVRHIPRGKERSYRSEGGRQAG